MATIKDKFKSLLALLGFTSFEASADGIFMQEGDLEKINTQLATLEQSVKDKDAEIATLNGKVTAAEQKVTDLTAQVNTLTTEKNEVQKKLDLAPGTQQPVKTEDKIETPVTTAKEGSVTSEARKLWEAAQAKKKKTN